MSTIIIPFALPLTWSADYEKNTALHLAKKNEVIAFLVGEGVTFKHFFAKHAPIIENSGKLTYFRPLYILPFQRIPIVKKMNFLLTILQLKILLFSRSKWRNSQKIFWTFTLQYAVLPHQLGREFIKIYDCVDGFVSENSTLRSLWRRYEESIINHSDVVFTNQETLYKRLLVKHTNVYRVPIGFSEAAFYKPRRKQQFDDIKKIPHPRVIFIGNISNRINFKFLKELISRTPSVNYIFIGHEDPYFTVPGKNFTEELARIKLLPNAYFLGEKPKSTIASYITASDIGLIPYDTSQEFNRLCFPMKVLEYFYVGKPIISTDIEEMKKLYPYVKIVDSPKEGAATINQLLITSWSRRSKRFQRKYAISNSWDKKIHAIRLILYRKFNLTI